MPNLKGWEWLIIVALILLLFGAKRLPVSYTHLDVYKRQAWRCAQNS